MHKSQCRSWSKFPVLHYEDGPKLSSESDVVCSADFSSDMARQWKEIVQTNNSAIVLRDSGNLNAAEGMMIDCLREQEKLLGSDSPSPVNQPTGELHPMPARKAQQLRTAASEQEGSVTGQEEEDALSAMMLNSPALSDTVSDGYAVGTQLAFTGSIATVCWCPSEAI